MLKMRLQRIGRKNDPAYRVIVTDSRQGPKSGKHVDLLGSYYPKTGEIKIDGDKAKDWISKGVQVSDTVHNMLVSQKIIEGKKVNNLPKKSPVIDEEAVKAAEEAEAKKAEEEKAAAEAPAEEAAEAEAPAEEVKDTEEKEEAPAEEEKKEETPAEEEKAEEVKEEEAPAEEAAPETEEAK